MDKELDDILYEFAETWFDAVRDKDAKTGIKAVKQARKAIQALITKEKNKLLQSILKELPEPADMDKYEGRGEDGGIDTTIHDDDPTGAKNGETLAHLAQFASDTVFNECHAKTLEVIKNRIEE